MSEATSRPERACRRESGSRPPPAPATAVRRVLQLLRPTLAALALAASGAAVPADGGDGIVIEHVAGVPYAELREALADAIADEGLTAPVVSRFAHMLERTATDLGHDAALYGDAEILTFCSAGVAARLVAEARERIALCPLSIAVYRLPQSPRDATLAYRPPTLDSPGGEAARALMARIVAGAARLVRKR